jgi:hypothetical protein
MTRHLTQFADGIFCVFQDEGWKVEFEIGHDDDGKIKAINVTAPGGGPCTGPRSRRRTGNTSSSGGGATKKPSANRGKGSSKQKEPFWHISLNGDVKTCLKEKEVRTTTGTVDVAFGDARIKLGSQGYASVAHAEGIIGEGKFVCSEDGTATFTWEHCISFDAASGSWVLGLEKTAVLPSVLSLLDGEHSVSFISIVSLPLYPHILISLFSPSITFYVSQCHPDRTR